MNEVAKNGGGELSEAEKLAIAEEFKAKFAKGELADGTIVKLNTRVEPDRKAEMEDRLAKIAALRKIGWDREEKARADYLKRREREKTEEAEEKAKAEAEIKSAVDEALRKKSEEESDAEEPKVSEEEALKAEAPVPVTDLNPEEQKKRRLIRWVKLQQINSKYAVIRSYGGKCVVMGEGRHPVNLRKKIYLFQFREAFEQWKANDFIPSLKKRNENDAVGPWWFRHPKRRQYDEVVFKPLAQEVIAAPGGQRLFNTYLGWGVEPKQGDWSLIRRHIKEVLANGDPKTDDYIIRWTAWGFQHPDELPLVALVLIGRKGRGKGTFARVLERIYGNHSIQISNQKHLVGNFNKHLENLILLIADEAYWAGHKADAGTLQRMITEPTLAVEPKGVDVRIVKNYIHLLMLAERNGAVPAGQDERRYAVYDVSEEVRDEAYFKALYKEIAEGGPAAMLYDLRQMNLGIGTRDEFTEPLRSDFSKI